MERIYLQNLIAWKDKYKRKPLLVTGARQVGKTYLVKELFAKRYFPNSYIYIDFKRQTDFNEIFSSTVDSNALIEFLQQKLERRIDKNTLLIFDEIQECPSVITSLKYFYQDNRDIPVIATRSMVRTKLKRRLRGNGKTSYFFPVGNIDELYVFPLNFEEFLFKKSGGNSRLLVAEMKSPLMRQ